MSSPIAHTLAGLSVGFLSWRRLFKRSFTWKAALFCVVMANLPDFDVFPGFLAGDINLYHHYYTHSIFFAFIVSLVVFAVAPRERLRWASACLLLIFSHYLVDYITIDRSPPIGLPLLWPFHEARFKWEHAFLPTVARAGTFFSLFNRHNIRTAAIEIAVFLPVAAVSYYFYKFRGKKTES